MSTPPSTAPMLPSGVRRRRSIGLVVCGLLLALIGVLAVFGTQVAPFSASAQQLLLGVSGPSRHHLLGTDDLGRDILSRIIVGTRQAIVGPIVVAVLAMIVGNTLGLLAAYSGGWVDWIIGRWADLMLALPGLLLVIVVGGVLGGGYWAAVLILSLLTAPYDTRLIRGAALEQMPLPYIEAARQLGLRPSRIMFAHVWPNLIPLVIGNTLLNVAFSLVTLSSLSFLGIGSPPGSPEWGRMVSENLHLMPSNLWSLLGPGLAIVVVAVTTNLTGDYLQETLAARGRS